MAARAYASAADALFFPPFFALAGLAVALLPSWLPLWALAAALAAAGVVGSFCAATRIAGIPAKCVASAQTSTQGA
jgi:hypothetical protein